MFKIINLRLLSEICGMDYYKLTNNLSGRYNSMDNNDRTEVANSAFLEVNKFFNRLGFHLTMERLKDREDDT